MTVDFSYLDNPRLSREYDLKAAVMVRQWGGEVWAVYLDDTLARYEVFVDAGRGRVFLSTDTWDGLDGEAEVAFEDDFITAYRSRRDAVLVRMESAVYRDGTEPAGLDDFLERADALLSLHGSTD